MSATHINYRHNPYTMKVTWENATEHDHTFFEIVLIVASSADHFVNGQQSSVSRGDIILLRPQDRHYFILYNIFRRKHFKFISERTALT